LEDLTGETTEEDRAERRAVQQAHNLRIMADRVRANEAHRKAMEG
jgi:hypothetical protein